MDSAGNTRCSKGTPKRIEFWAPLLVLIVVAAVLRVAYARDQALWADELFSLALATGHSLEGPPFTWDAARGDFFSYEAPTAPADLRRYLEHEVPVASPAQVSRAVLLSDTNAPGYYLALWLWTLLINTHDLSLRLFSIAWAVACVPMLWVTAQMIGGRRVAFTACTLFAVLPLSIDYSIEVRMYSMLWFWSISIAWATLMLRRFGARPELLVIWTLISAAGLLTHYFFAFACGPIALWLLIQPGRLRRWHVIACVAAVAVLIAPWYMHILQSFTAWRVTKDWLKDPSVVVGEDKYRPFFYLAHNALAPFWDMLTSWRRMAGFAAVGLALMAWSGRRAIAEGRLLVWLWWLGPALGLFVVDAVLDTYTAAIPRYALAALPATMLLVGILMSPLPRSVYIPLLGLMVMAALPAMHRLFTSEGRNSWGYQRVARLLDQRAGPDQLVLVHSVPSGFLGIARYTHAPTVLALWTQQLRKFEGRNNVKAIARDVTKLTAGWRKIFVVAIHDVNEPSPELDYLRQHANLVAESRQGRARVAEFLPTDCGVFTWPPTIRNAVPADAADP
jgi:uncharacterized membrane protein